MKMDSLSANLPSENPGEVSENRGEVNENPGEVNENPGSEVEEEGKPEPLAEKSENPGGVKEIPGSEVKEEGKPEEPLAEKWFHISDAHVSEVSVERVLKCQAYLLFYERTL